MGEIGEWVAYDGKLKGIQVGKRFIERSRSVKRLERARFTFFIKQPTQHQESDSFLLIAWRHMSSFVDCDEGHLVRGFELASFRHLPRLAWPFPVFEFLHSILGLVVPWKSIVHPLLTFRIAAT